MGLMTVNLTDMPKNYGKKKMELIAMAEYVVKEAAIKEIMSDVPEQVGYSREDAADCIRYMDAADVAPVVHGRWIHTDLASHWYGKDECSECTYHEHDRRDLSNFNFCPNCGAKMDGGADNEK